MIRQCLAVLCFCILAAPSMVVAQDVTVYSNRSKVENIKDFDLKGDARTAFREFRRKAEYFGTIYVNRPERLAGAYWNANSVALADSYARTLCHARSKNAQYCVLYARVLPRNFDANVFGITLSRAANKEYREYQKLQNSDRFGAFAVSDSGAVGYSWAEASVVAAQDQAMRRCAKSARKVLRRTAEDMKPIVAGPEHQQCRLIHTTR